MKNKRNKTNNEGDILKKIKTSFVDVIVRQWLNTPIKEWGNKTPLQIIKAGRGSELYSALLTVEQELKEERNKLNENRQKGVDETSEPTEPLYAKFI